MGSHIRNLSAALALYALELTSSEGEYTLELVAFSEATAAHLQ